MPGKGHEDLVTEPEEGNWLSHVLHGSVRMGTQGPLVTLLSL